MPSDRPRLQVVHAAAAGLPAPLSPFIGRDRELTELSQLLATTRLVSVTGAGGSGKTRLALEAARLAAAAGPWQVGWVELASLGRADLLVPHVAAQLKVQDAPDRPIIESLVDVLRQGDFLLVLDNCEHLVDACAELVTLLLRRCERLTILTTSREALGIEGERAWLLRGLAVDAAPEGSAAGVAQSEAVRLFVDRAQAVSTAFELTAANAAAVAQICRRLDGLPLAIELAAARIPVLTPAEVAARLDDVFRLLPAGTRSALPRHRTLRAAVEWSYQLIPPAEQLLLQRLAVFAGTFSLEAAEQVCQGDGLDAAGLLDLLANLVARSLVAMQEDGGTARYRLLEIVRQFGWEHLGAAPGAPAALQRRHAEYYVSLAEQALPHLEAEHSAAWAVALTAERGNLGAALHWAFRDGDRLIGHRLVGALWWYWGQTGQWAEWGFWQAQALGAPEATDGAAWGQVLNGAGSLAYIMGDTQGARPLLERAAAVLERSGDPTHQAIAMSTLGHLLCSLGELDAALRVGEAAAAVARPLRAAWPLCHVMSNALGHTCIALGQFDRAEAYLREAQDHAERSGGHNWGVSQVSLARARLAMQRGRLAEARPHARAAIASASAIRDPHHATRVLLRTVRLLAAGDGPGAAARLCGSIAAARSAGLPVLLDEAREHDATVAALRETLGPDAFARAFDEGHGWSVWEALDNADEQLGGFGPGPQPSPPAAAPRPPELSVRTLGGLEVLVGGAPPPGDAWSHAKPRELLVYLLCHPEGRTREQIGLAFWPEASAVQVKNSFHVLLHKLRKALGAGETIVAAGGRYRVSTDAGLWFDAAEFERGITAGLRAGPGGADGLEAALSLYRGDFLEGETAGDWSLAIHDRLRRLYADGLSALADIFIERQNFPAAVVRLEELVRREDVREEAYRRLMLCLARLGRREQALGHYRRLVAVLRRELDAEPEAETEALAKRLAEASG